MWYISSEIDETNPITGRKAAATKDHYDNPVEGIYVFNPNTGLRAAAEAEHMTEEQQGAEWLRLWSQVWKEAGKRARCRIGRKAVTGPR